eukprot:m.72938 g.72938  ORF g.72938 m.72938 type:complete len:59 (-) comp14294_c0_seq2:71-247(-)
MLACLHAVCTFGQEMHHPIACLLLSMLTLETLWFGIAVDRPVHTVASSSNMENILNSL